jgi:rhodanese-related sulfurtransferase
MNALISTEVAPTDQTVHHRRQGGAGPASCMLGVIAILMGVAPAMAYDEVLAASYEKFFSAFAEEHAAKALQLMPVDKVVEAINKGDDLVLLDVRTGYEQSLIGLTYSNTLHMPMNEVFKPENLARIPTDKTLVVTCHSGVRCTAVALALRSIGFEQVYSMKGGLTEFMKYLDAKTAFSTGEENKPKPAGPN